MNSLFWQQPQNFCLGLIYSLFFAGLVFFSARMLVKFRPQITTWREFWIIATSLSLVPLILTLLPNPFQQWSSFNLNDLTLTVESMQSVLPRDVLRQSQSTPVFKLKNIFELVSWLYIAGLIIQLVRFSLRLNYLAQLTRESQSLLQANSPLSPIQYRFLNRVEARCGIKVRISDRGHSPFILQFFGTRLFIPVSTLEELDETQFRLVIRHEWHHKQNNDGRIQLLIQLLLCFNWFNPFSHWLAKQSNWAIEMNCDKEVLSGRQNLQRTYALAMLKVLRRSATNLSHQPVAAFSSKSHRSITMRINHIMDPSVKSFKSFFSRLGLYTGATLLGATALLLQPSVQAAGNGAMINPLPKSKITSPYGAHNEFHRFHNGMDLGAKTGTPIVAAASGKVIVATEKLRGKANYGTIIILDHGNGLQSVYAHLSALNVFEGDTVEQGQLIGKVGSTGRATGPHLHLEIHQSNKAVDPSTFINFES